MSMIQQLINHARRAWVWPAPQSGNGQLRKAPLGPPTLHVGAL